MPVRRFTVSPLEMKYRTPETVSGKQNGGKHSDKCSFPRGEKKPNAPRRI